MGPSPDAYEQAEESATVLITGGCGFIGTNLVLYLGEHGFSTRILDDFSNRSQAWDGPEPPDVATSIVQGDVCDPRVVREALHGVSCVVHLAACTDVMESLKDPLKAWRANVNGTLNLLECCREYPVVRILLASSNAVLGNQDPPVHEMMVPAPISIYGASKLACESLCLAYHRSFGLSTKCLRFSNCYGPHSELKTSVVNRFLTALLHDRPLVVYGDGRQTRDFIHVDDVCQAILLAMTTREEGSRVLQIGSGTETSVNELIAVLGDVTGKTPEVEFRPARKADIVSNYSDISTARRALGFEPTVGLREGLTRLHESYGARRR